MDFLVGFLFRFFLVFLFEASSFFLIFLIVSLLILVRFLQLLSPLRLLRRKVCQFLDLLVC